MVLGVIFGILHIFLDKREKLMPRARNIKYGFFQNEELPEIDPLGRLLFIGLWCLCDREGRTEDRPKRIKAQLFPYEDCDLDLYLSDLEAKGFIFRYEVSGQRYLQVINFNKHQTPHKTEKGSVIPAPNDNGAITVKEREGNVKPPNNNGELTEPPPPDSLILNTDSKILIPDSSNTDYGHKQESVHNTSSAIHKIFNHWKAKMEHPKARLDDERKGFINKALQSGYSIDDICQAIDGCSKTPHNIGQNAKGQRYDGLHIVLKNADQIDRFIRNNKNPPTVHTTIDIRSKSNIETLQHWAQEKLSGEAI